MTESWSLTATSERVVKIGAKVIAHDRYAAFQMSGVAVPRDLFRRILDMIDALRPREPVPCIWLGQIAQDARKAKCRPPRGKMGWNHVAEAGHGHRVSDFAATEAATEPFRLSVRPGFGYSGVNRGADGLTIWEMSVKRRRVSQSLTRNWDYA